MRLRKPKNTKNYKDDNTIKFGSHLMFDAYGCDCDKLDSVSYCTRVLNKCVEICKMNRLIDPVVIKVTPNTAVGGKDPGGCSGFVIIQESHISLHSFSKRGFVTMDVYSCKEFDPKETIKYLNKAFGAKDCNVLVLDRGLKYPKDNIYS